MCLGGPYEIFAGRDASRGLAKQSFEEDMLVPVEGEIDTLSDLTKSEWENLTGWESKFTHILSISHSRGTNGEAMWMTVRAGDIVKRERKRKTLICCEISLEQVIFKLNTFNAGTLSDLAIAHNEILIALALLRPGISFSRSSKQSFQGVSQQSSFLVSSVLFILHFLLHSLDDVLGSRK